jgi:hypothetical protein
VAEDQEGHVTAEEMRDELGADGYVVRRAPDRHVHLLDADVAKKSKCDQCGHRGLDYEPWTRLTGRGYRALAICPDCGHAAEF